MTGLEWAFVIVGIPFVSWAMILTLQLVGRHEERTYASYRAGLSDTLEPLHDGDRHLRIVRMPFDQDEGGGAA